ncbi:MAG: D-alanyl-D-alanine carboxypeptidase/D-alanyl-D-alanine-endopeptidase [Rhodobacteraceae bacterium]|nr:D-alanyl-D-alanine carboxypeptidase/D-alanyl-D-alanine-endopeptidase [Paracoccaceae bacterium]
MAAGQLWANAPLTSIRPVPRAREVTRAVARPVESLIARADLGGKLGYVVADARTGKVLETKNPLLPLPPASVAKAVTAAYGLETLGADYHFRTRLIATGPLEGGRLNGDLVLIGGGDPVMDTNDLADMARSLKAAGVNEVTGKFKVFAGALPYQRQIDKEQPDHLGYNPSVSGVNLNFNRVYFQWKRAASGYNVTMDARSDKYRPEVAISRMQVVERDMPVYTYRQDGDIDHWTVARGALGDAGSRWLPVRRPDIYAGEVFQSLARSHGIRLSPPVEVNRSPGGTVLVEHRSASLSAITKLMLKYSTNLTAEVIGLTASSARGHSPRSLSSSARMMNSWMKESLGTKHAKMADHSGLSDASRLSAIDMVKALVQTGSGGQLHGLMKEVVPVDEAGRQSPNAAHSIRAKTGTLNFVSSLAGYETTQSGRPLVFAIFTADMERRGAIKRSDRERPEGARGWSRSSRWLQHQLLNRWADLYDS